MSEVESHLEALKKLLDEHTVLSQQNHVLTEENNLLKQRIGTITSYAQAILALCSGVEVKQQNRLPNVFEQGVEILNASTRVYNCLQNRNIFTVRDLVQRTEAELLRLQHFGKKSLKELKEILTVNGLRLGMTEDDILSWK